MIKRNLKKFKTRTKNKLLIAFDYYSNEQIWIFYCYYFVIIWFYLIQSRHLEKFFF
jgi:hypothetical protein